MAHMDSPAPPRQCLDFSLGCEQIFIFVWHLWFEIKPQFFFRAYGQILVSKLANLGGLVKAYQIPPI